MRMIDESQRHIDYSLLTSKGAINLYQSLLGEKYVYSSQFQEGWRRSFFCRDFLALSNLPSVVVDLCGGGNQRYEMSELAAKLFHSDIVDLKEKVGLGL